MFTESNNRRVKINIKPDEVNINIIEFNKYS